MGKVWLLTGRKRLTLEAIIFEESEIKGERRGTMEKLRYLGFYLGKRKGKVGQPMADITDELVGLEIIAGFQMPFSFSIEGRVTSFLFSIGGIVTKKLSLYSI